MKLVTTVLESINNSAQSSFNYQTICPHNNTTHLLINGIPFQVSHTARIQSLVWLVGSLFHNNNPAAASDTSNKLNRICTACVSGPSSMPMPCSSILDQSGFCWPLLSVLIIQPLFINIQQICSFSQSAGQFSGIKDSTSGEHPSDATFGVEWIVVSAN